MVAVEAVERLRGGKNLALLLQDPPYLVDMEAGDDGGAEGWRLLCCGNLQQLLDLRDAEEMLRLVNHFPEKLRIF